MTLEEALEELKALEVRVSEAETDFDLAKARTLLEIVKERIRVAGLRGVMRPASGHKRGIRLVQ